MQSDRKDPVDLHPDLEGNRLNSKPEGRVLLLLSNGLSLLTSDVLNKATTFLVYAMVARYLGLFEFGQLSVGLLLLYTCQVFCAMGLPMSITRTVARNPKRARDCWLHGLILAGVTGVIITALLCVLTFVIGYSPSTTNIILVLSIGLIPYGLAIVSESVLRGLERMHWIALANVPANIAKVGLTIYLLHSGHGLVAIAILLVIVRFMILATEIVGVYAATRAYPFQFSISFGIKLAKEASTFLGLDGLIALWSCLSVVMLSRMVSEEAAGLYSSSAQLLQPVTLVFKSVIGTLFPSLCRAATNSTSEFGHIVTRMLALLLTIAMPSAVLMFVLAPEVLLIYGDEFNSHGWVLKAFSLMLLLNAGTTVLGHAILARGKERVILRVVQVNLVVDLLLGFVLISQYGLAGAVITTLVVWVLNFAMHYAACLKEVDNFLFDATVSSTVISAIGMIVVATLLGNQSHFTAAAVSLTTYVAFLVLLLVSPNGGIREFSKNFFAPLVNEGGVQ